jgi:hypothetical protein
MQGGIYAESYQSLRIAGRADHGGTFDFATLQHYV